MPSFKEGPTTDKTQEVTRAVVSPCPPSSLPTAKPLSPPRIGSPPKVEGERSVSLSSEPVTDDMFDKLGKMSAEDEGKRHVEKMTGGSTTSTAFSGSSRRPSQKYKPTALSFRELEDQERVAKCILVLCNISDRALQFRLKSSSGSNIVSVPFGNGHIAPHSQLRLTMTWTRSSKYKTWDEVPLPKLVLTTRFLDVISQDSELTHTRLVARIGKKRCSAANPPVEQLLLDAAGKEKEEKLIPVNPENDGLGQALADFVNNLSDRGLCVLIVVFIVFVLVFSGGRR